MTFLEDLAKKGVIDQSQVSLVLDRSREMHGGNIALALIELGMNEDDLTRMRGEFFNIPTKKISIKSFNFDVLKYIPQDSSEHYNFVPIGMTDGVLEIGVIEPDNIEAMNALQFIASKLNTPFKLFLISHSDFKEIMSNYKGLSGEVDQALSEFDTSISQEDAENVLRSATKSQTSGNDENKITEDAPIIKIVAVILNHATEGNASDIHIENTGERVKVRFRVDGILHTSLVLPPNVYSGIVARIKILAKLKLDEKRKPQDGGFSAKIAGRKVDFRVSTFPAYYGEKVVMRILDSEKGVKPLAELGLSPENEKIVRDALARPYGLILITGPTGSGKTTTLYSMLKELDREQANVVSLEDPVEYHIPDIAQSQVMPEIGYTFASGIRSILRQDPDIIMVGEIRDLETAKLAIQAALTGHLVLSTLHTNSAIGVVPRLVDMGVDPYLIAPTLTLAIAQRLTRTMCPSARKKIPLDEATKIMLEKQFADLPKEHRDKIKMDENMYEMEPSSECPSGTRGRTAVFEMFSVDKEMQNVILKNPVEQEIFKVAREKGMLTMKEDGFLKSLKGEIPIQDAYAL
ncbi:MAG: type pilus assembly protein PilB [Patescibacteria group bacterium]|jgi:type IV pilus assembly protein PilB|nr:type pilus assembly protein PilB [Patescibacteria group bacterium]